MQYLYDSVQYALGVWVSFNNKINVNLIFCILIVILILEKVYYSYWIIYGLLFIYSLLKSLKKYYTKSLQIDKVKLVKKTNTVNQSTLLSTKKTMTDIDK